MLRVFLASCVRRSENRRRTSAEPLQNLRNLRGIPAEPPRNPRGASGTPAEPPRNPRGTYFLYVFSAPRLSCWFCGCSRWLKHAARNLCGTPVEPARNPHRTGAEPMRTSAEQARNPRGTGAEPSRNRHGARCLCAHLQRCSE